MDAFGYNALSGFLGSSNIKSNKQEQLRYLDSILKSQQRQQLLEQRDAENSQKIIDTSYQAAYQSITGDHARPKDILEFEQLSQSLLEPINEKIRRAGGYQKAKRLGIDADLRAYAFKLNNNEKVMQMKQNTANYAKYFEAISDPKTANLFPLSDLKSIDAWHRGETDVIQYRGHLDAPIDLSFIDETPQDKRIEEIDYVLANKETLAADYAYYVATTMGLDKANERLLHERAINNPEEIVTSGYLKQRLGIDIGDSLPVKFGTKDIVTSLPEEMIRGQQLTMGNGVRAADLQEYGGVGSYIKDKGLGVFFETTFGASDALANLESKESIVADVAYELFATDDRTKFRVLDAYLGDKLYTTRGGKLKINIDEAFLEESYNYKGASMKGDVGFMDRTADDMEINGVFLGMKAVYTDSATGELKSKLLVKGVRDLDPTDRATYINKVLEGVAEKETVKFMPAYIMQLNEPDILADDIYYHELNLGKDYFVSALRDENYDEKLSFNKNARANILAEKESNRKRADLDVRVLNNLNNIYATDDGIGVQTLFAQHAPTAIATFAMNDIHNRMTPYIMADIFDMAQQVTLVQKSRNQNANFSTNVNNILRNFSSIAKDDPSLFKAYQSGDPSALLDYYRENKKDLYKQKETRFKLWGKYFN